MIVDRLTLFYNRRRISTKLSSAKSTGIQRYGRLLSLVVFDLGSLQGDQRRARSPRGRQRLALDRVRCKAAPAEGRHPRMDGAARSSRRFCLRFPASAGARIRRRKDPEHRTEHSGRERAGGDSLHGEPRCCHSRAGRSGSAEELYKRADERMYEAKQAGRNRASG